MVSDWVKSGGALLLIADHAPFGGAAAALASRFGVDMSKGYTFDPENSVAGSPSHSSSRARTNCSPAIRSPKVAERTSADQAVAQFHRDSR